MFIPYDNDVGDFRQVGHEERVHKILNHEEHEILRKKAEFSGGVIIDLKGSIRETAVVPNFASHLCFVRLINSIRYD